MRMALLLTIAAAALLALGFALWLVTDDLSSHSDEFDGLGVFFGLAIAAPAALAGGGCVIALVLMRRRPSAEPPVSGILGLSMAVPSAAALVHAQLGWSAPLLVVALGLVLTAWPDARRRGADLPAAGRTPTGAGQHS